MSNGLNDYAGNSEMRIGLREPFPPKLVSRVDKGSHSEDYVNHAAVTDRLNTEAPAWTTSKPEWIWSGPEGTGRHIAGVLCSMTIGSVTRWEVGDVDRASNPGAEAKLAMSDFIKRAAMRFGVGLDLWSKEDLDGAKASKYQGTATSPSKVAPAAPSTPGGATLADGASTFPFPGGGAPSQGSDVAPGSYGEDGPGATTLEGTNELASDQQWDNLLGLVEGSKAKAANRINKANHTHYSYPSAREGATWQELVKAME